MKTPLQWAEHFSLIIVDPDGWRTRHPELPARAFLEPISETEFVRRCAISTTTSSIEAGQAFLKRYWELMEVPNEEVN